MDAFTAIFTPFTASAAEETMAPIDEAKKQTGIYGFYCVVA